MCPFPPVMAIRRIPTPPPRPGKREPNAKGPIVSTQIRGERRLDVRALTAPGASLPQRSKRRNAARFARRPPPHRHILLSAAWGPRWRGVTQPVVLLSSRAHRCWREIAPASSPKGQPRRRDRFRRTGAVSRSRSLPCSEGLVESLQSCFVLAARTLLAPSSDPPMRTELETVAARVLARKLQMLHTEESSLPAQLRSAVRRPAITAAGRRKVFGAASFRIVPRLQKPAFGVGAHPRLVHSTSPAPTAPRARVAGGAEERY